MKRWAILLGRCGTVLLSIGLAMLLVSFIPSAQTSTTERAFFLYPNEWRGNDEGILTPQQSLRFSVDTNGTLKVYVLEVNFGTVWQWINERHPGMGIYSNVTFFEEFLAANPEPIAWQYEIPNGRIEYEYVPTKITNTTVFFSNPTLNSDWVQYSAFLSAVVAPRGKVRTLAEWAMPFGVVLALPWLISWLRTRRRSPTT